MEHNSIRYYRFGRRVFLNPPTRVQLLAEYPDRRVWLVEYNECYSPKVRRALRKLDRKFARSRNNKAQPTSKTRRRLEKAGRKAARR